MSHPKFLALSVPLLLILPLTREAAPLQVMSFNIRYGTAEDGDNSWNFRKGHLIQLIRDQAPQLLGIQEALRFQLDEIRSALPQFAETGCGRDDGLTRGEYAAILYDTARFLPMAQGTFWFSDTPSLPGSVSWGNKVTRICSWVRFRDKTELRTIEVYNLHLDHESQQSRYRSVQALLDTIHQRSSLHPVFIMGDFNAGESNPAVTLLRNAGFADTYREVHPLDSLVGTFHGFNGSSQGEKIDYIFTDGKTSVVDATILRNSLRGRYPSDHFPVTARIQFDNGR